MRFARASDSRTTRLVEAADRIIAAFVSPTKHSGNTIVVFCIERVGRSPRLSCSTQAYCGETGRRRQMFRNDGSSFNGDGRIAKSRQRSMFLDLVETTTAIDDLASAFVTTRLEIHRRVPAGGKVLFSTIAH
jgi:hypothetical protein